MTLTININEEIFILHQSGAVFWEAKNTLLISDVHLGKVAHFRKHGIAIPNNALLKNFSRLNDVCEAFQPGRIIFLGDLFHSKLNTEWDLFVKWTKKNTSEIILVEGNHDIIDKQKYTDINIKTCSEFLIDDFLLTHHPTPRENFFNFCGHIHPGICLRGVGKQSLKLPCFFQKGDQMILPAFGEFTGNYYMGPTENDLVYAITENEVILVSGY